MNLDFPYHFSRSGRTAETDEAGHIRDLIEQVLFTAPGERVMRPDFGSGVAQLVFALNSVEVAGATQMLVQGALQKWLGEKIAVLEVRAEPVDSQLIVTVRYQLLRDGRIVTEAFRSSTGRNP
jgi:phage baseplate assembly protein W